MTNNDEKQNNVIGFSEAIGDDSYGLIVDKNGILQGIWVPEENENKKPLPEPVAKLCLVYFGIDPNDPLTYNRTIH
jgi:hypothetical protein